MPELTGGRSSGVLLHITSLPSAFGVGDFGPQAYRFIDFLAQAGQSVWQVLPLTPTDPTAGHSPYHSSSAFAGNPMLISPEVLAAEGLIDNSLPASGLVPYGEKLDFDQASRRKNHLLDCACERWAAGGEERDFQDFCEGQRDWLDDFALFSVLKSEAGKRSWTQWESGLRKREASSLEQAGREFSSRIKRIKFLQYVFHKQWTALKNYAGRKGIRIIGDIPFYVTFESSDVWAYPHYFELDEHDKPHAVAGVPPDYFSRNGQLWGNPIYRWNVLQSEGFDWWVRRLRHSFQLYDMVRIDHFRGFVGFWRIPAGNRTARSGSWESAPAKEFFSFLIKQFPCFPVIAEDLGLITPDVAEIMQFFGFPGMRVMMFGFGDDDPGNLHLPGNYPSNCAAFTGTHDNNTIRGWFRTETNRKIKSRIFAYLKKRVKENEIAWEFIRRVMESRAGLAVVPMQDYLNLADEGRMNRPASLKGNWCWRLDEDHLSDDLAAKIAEMTRESKRAP